MSKTLLPTEPSQDDEVTCHNCQRDLKDRGVLFVRVDDEVVGLCYGCVAEIK